MRMPGFSVVALPFLLALVEQRATVAHKCLVCSFVQLEFENEESTRKSLIASQRFQRPGKKLEEKKNNAGFLSDFCQT